MGAFREIAYGIPFFVLSLGSAWPTVFFLGPPPDAVLGVAITAAVGATIGGGTWLYFRRVYLRD